MRRWLGRGLAALTGSVIVVGAATGQVAPTLADWLSPCPLEGLDGQARCGTWEA